MQMFYHFLNLLMTLLVVFLRHNTAGFRISYFFTPGRGVGLSNLFERAESVVLNKFNTPMKVGFGLSNLFERV